MDLTLLCHKQMFRSITDMRGSDAKHRHACGSRRTEQASPMMLVGAVSPGQYVNRPAGTDERCQLGPPLFRPATYANGK
jgi:hypothetical protein